MKRYLLLFLAALPLIGVACTKMEPQAGSVPDASAAAVAQADLIKKGERVYRANCSMCHNLDPKIHGSLGPAIAGSSKELLQARVVRGEYPPGYTPKRKTQVMPKFENLASEIDALTAYLNQ